MKFSKEDKYNYFKGMLVLVAKDKNVKDEEKRIVKRLGTALGLEKEYCRDMIADVSNNKYILESPPVFSNETIARLFIKDGIKLGFADKSLHLYELNWLKLVAEANGLDKKWCILQIEDYFDVTGDEKDEEELEIIKQMNSL